MNSIVAAIIGGLGGILFFIGLWLMIKDIVMKSCAVEIGEPDKEYVETINKMRSDLITLIINNLVNAWRLGDEESEKVEIAQTDGDSYIINFVYENIFFSFYIDWNKKMIAEITYNYRNSCRVYRKTFSIRNGRLNYGRFYKFLLKMRAKMKVDDRDEMKKITQEKLDTIIASVKNGALAGVEMTPEEYWKEWYSDILSDGTSKDSLIHFTMLTACLFDPKNKEDKEVSK